MSSPVKALRTERARSATVMFADISGFTALGERLDPEEVIGIINGCFERLEAIVYARGGAIDEYLGDCVKAAFGLTLTAGDGADLAVQAAFEMRDAVAQYNVDRGIEPPLGIHVGLSTGPVATVPTGSLGNNRTCVMGAAARVASALEDVSERGQIFVGPATMSATSHLWEYRRVEVDGEDASEVFELLGRLPQEHKKRDSERRGATIVFADLIGADDIAPDARGLEVKMGELFESLREAVVEHEGVVNQYTGDGVMALFGIPNAIEDAPKQALNSAIRIRELVRRYAAEKEVPLTVHIGVNTGRVIAGEIGGSVRKSFTGVGDTVNLSARIKEAAPADEIYIGPETHRLVQGRFSFSALEPMNFKGKSKPVPVFRLSSETRQIHRQDAQEGRRRIFSDLVGRDREVGAIEGRLRDLEEGRGGAISIIAEAGLGKTRLLGECVSKVNRETVRILPARSVSMGAGLSFHPFVDLIRAWAVIDEQDAGDVATQKLDSALRILGDQAEELQPFIATLLGLRLSATAAARLDAMEGEVIEKFVTRSVRVLLEAIAQEKPTVVIMEDVHWADQSSVTLIEAILPVAAMVPILFVFMLRPDFAETGDRVVAMASEKLASRHDALALSPLDQAAIEKLIYNLLDVADLPETIRAAILEKAGGNPFFIEEVVGELIDAEAVVLEDGRYRVTEKIGEFTIPSTVQEVIMVRIDRLDESKRHILQLASVIGRSFSAGVLAELVDGETGLAEDLEVLRQRQIVTDDTSNFDLRSGDRTVDEELEFMFRHALAQETIYESILFQTRRKFHGRVGLVMEARYAKRLNEFYSRLAYHFSEAQDLPKAEDYSFRAAGESARAGASREALRYFRQAASLDAELHGEKGDPAHRSQLEKGIGLAMLNTGQLPESLSHFDRALIYLGERLPSSNLAIQSKFVVDAVSVLADLALPRALRSRRPGSERDSEFFEILNARARAAVTSDPRRIFYDNISGVRRMNGLDATAFEPGCSLYGTAGGMFCFTGMSFGIARRFLERAIASRGPDSMADDFVCRYLEFTINYLDGQWGEDCLLEQSFLDQALRAGLFWDLNTYLGLAADRLQRQGRFEEAGRHLDGLATLRDAYDFEFASANLEGESAMFHLERRDLPAGLESVERYLDGREEYALRVLALGTKAKILVHLGDEQGAEQILAEAEEIVTAETVPPWHASNYGVARLNLDVEIASRSSVPSTRRAHLKRARKSRSLALGLTRAVASQRTEALRLAGSLAWLEGRPARARSYWGQSLASGLALGARPETARTRLEISRHLDADESFAGLAVSEHHRLGVEDLSQMDLAWDLEGISA